MKRHTANLTLIWIKENFDTQAKIVELSNKEYIVDLERITIPFKKINQLQNNLKKHKIDKEEIKQLTITSSTNNKYVGIY